MIYIAEYLRAVGEPSMAAEVETAHNRLEAFAHGFDHAAFDTLHKAATDMQARITTLTAQRDRLVESAREVIKHHGSDDVLELAAVLEEIEKK